MIRRAVVSLASFASHRTLPRSTHATLALLLLSVLLAAIGIGLIASAIMDGEPLESSVLVVVSMNPGSRGSTESLVQTDEHCSQPWPTEAARLIIRCWLNITNPGMGAQSVRICPQELRDSERTINR